MGLKTTCTKNVKFKIIKIRTGCPYIGCLCYNKYLNWAAQNLWMGHGFDPCYSQRMSTWFHYSFRWVVFLQQPKYHGVPAVYSETPAIVCGSSDCSTHKSYWVILIGCWRMQGVGHQLFPSHLDLFCGKVIRKNSGDLFL